jgi:hypothetical protein
VPISWSDCACYANPKTADVNITERPARQQKRAAHLELHLVQLLLQFQLRATPFVVHAGQQLRVDASVAVLLDDGGLRVGCNGLQSCLPPSTA